MTNHDPVPERTTDATPDTRAGDPIPNPGLHEHTWRPTDVDEKAEKRAERQVASFFLASMVFAVLFVVAYFTIDFGSEQDGEGGWAQMDLFFGMGAGNMALGLTLGLALLSIGVGVVQWARKLMSDVEIVEDRHPVASSAEDRETALAALQEGATDSGIGRRPLIRNTLIGSVAMLGLPAIVALRDLGPTPGDALEHTVWAEGMRVVNDTSGIPLRPRDIEIGQLVNAEPEGLVHAPGEEHHEEDRSDRPEHIQEHLEYTDGLTHTERLTEMAKAAVILVRMQPKDITFSDASPENWAVDGILCYSKICTHVGCPISLWEQQTHHLLCPCHQSTFDLADAGKVLFGPAARSLPQLPISVDDEGYLVAQSDFLEPVGPSYWERG